MSCSTKYHVFVSFRGEDTRLNFTSHLHAALEAKGLETFKDFKSERGEEIWPKLAQAIDHSHISLVVFSENYAKSKWCLEELDKILECRKLKGQVVVPVFYNIDPSLVRNITGSYAEAFAKYERDLANDESKKDKVPKWRSALTEASSISGWDSRQKDEFQFIQDIVNDVLQKLSLRYPKEIQGVHGIERVCDDIGRLLKKVSKIGIWGMGGIGKTTIAKVMFAKHFPEYDSVCFFPNVREQTQRLGEEYTHANLLSELLKDKVSTSDCIGSAFIKRRLSNRKLFIVLDDVDSALQLDALCAELGDLGEGSKLIVTTRNKNLLNGRVEEVYAVQLLGPEKSLNLFSFAAFKQSKPQKGYEHFSNRAVQYAAGNPLALKVLGSHFRSQSSDFWECELKKIENKKESFREIESVLRVSYDGLEKSQQAIFLDIAFFFKNKNKNVVEKILNACDFSASGGIKILQDKALITISENTIQMHDVLQQMGLDIVRDKLSKDFGTRFRDSEEVLDVLINKRSAAVEGITLDLSPIQRLQLSADTFHLITNLRYLQLHIPSGKRSETVYQCTDLRALPRKLRYLEWNGFPFRSLPPTFEAEFLVEIRLPYSHVRQLWKGEQALGNLEAIDLSECKQLIKLPDLSKASKLKGVNLSGCESLCHIHLSLLSRDTLETLILDRCKKLKSLKSDKHLSSLKTLSVNDCSSLEEFSVSSELISLLDLSMTRVKTLGSSMGRLSKLWWLNIEGSRLKNLPDELSCLTCLANLRISNCGQVLNKQKLHILFGGLKSLRVLHLKHCYKLRELPDNISTLSSLHELRLDGSSVERLPASIKHLQRLQILSLENCKKLRFLPELPTSIKQFDAVNCISLETVTTLKTFALQMRGEKKFISFKNGKKLQGSSLLSIMEDTEFTMLSAAFHNSLVRWVSTAMNIHSYNYNNVEVLLPGSSVPGPFTYQTKGSSITFEIPDRLSNLVGFILCVVISPSPGIKQHPITICCEYPTRYCMSKWDMGTIMELNSNHVLISYDPFRCDRIISESYKNLRLDFYARTQDHGELDGLISIKECGIYPLCYTESMFHDFLKKLDLELNLKLELGLKLGLALDIKQYRGDSYINRKLLYALEFQDPLSEPLKLELESRRHKLSMSIETENSAISPQIQQHQEQDLTQTCSCSCSCHCIVDILMFFWRLISK